MDPAIRRYCMGSPIRSDVWIPDFLKMSESILEWLEHENTPKCVRNEHRTTGLVGSDDDVLELTDGNIPFYLDQPISRLFRLMTIQIPTLYALALTGHWLWHSNDNPLTSPFGEIFEPGDVKGGELKYEATTRLLPKFTGEPARRFASKRRAQSPSAEFAW